MAVRLRPVPDAPRRAIGLVRVSKERDNMISPELQRSAITAYAQRRGYVVVDWVEGIDESGSKAGSAWWPRLNQTIELVEAGTVDVILVWKYSRTARHRLRWAVALDRVESAGGTIESATEDIDTTTSTGRFTRGMLAELAAFEAERIGDTWKEAQARRASLGLPTSGRPRFGYSYVDGHYEPHPEQGPLLAALYRRYVNGESVYVLAEWLNRNGYRTDPDYRRGGDGLWSARTLRTVLDRGFGAGLIVYQGRSLPGAHTPVIDDALWEAYQVARDARRQRRRGERSEYLLSGMVRCAVPLPDGSPCRSPMYGGRFGVGQAQTSYRCHEAGQLRRHRGGFVAVERVHNAVADWLAREAADVDTAGVQTRERTKIADRRARDADAIAAEITELDRQLATATRQLLREVVTEAAYDAATGQIEAERALLVARHAEAVAASTAPVNTAAIAADLLADWDLLLVAERRAILRKLIREVTVVASRTAPVVDVVPRWAQNSD